MISLRTHNILDYVAGALLLVVPFVFGFSDVAAARNLFLVAGFGLIAYSLLTNYYYSVAKIIPVGVHMGLDVLVGLVTILGPTLFNYRGFITGGQSAVHWIMGLAAIGLVAVTRERTDIASDRLHTGTLGTATPR